MQYHGNRAFVSNFNRLNGVAVKTLPPRHKSALASALQGMELRGSRHCILVMPAILKLRSGTGLPAIALSLPIQSVGCGTSSGNGGVGGVGGTRVVAPGAGFGGAGADLGHTRPKPFPVTVSPCSK